MKKKKKTPVENRKFFIYCFAGKTAAYKCEKRPLSSLTLFLLSEFEVTVLLQLFTRVSVFSLILFDKACCGKYVRHSKTVFLYYVQLARVRNCLVTKSLITSNFQSSVLRNNFRKTTHELTALSDTFVLVSERLF